MDLIIKLAAMIDQLGGIDEAAKALDLEDEAIERLLGDTATRQDTRDLNYAIASIERDPETALDNGIDLDEIDERVERLAFFEESFNDDRLYNTFLNAYIDGKITDAEINEGGYDFFHDTTLTEATNILNYIRDHDDDASGFVNAYRSAIEAKGTIYSKDSDGSLWYEYLRSIGIDES